MNASIRLLFLMSMLLPACAAGTRVDATLPRPVREPLVLADQTAAHGPASVPGRDLRTREPERIRASWKPTAVR